MNKYFLILQVILVALFVSGCSQKVTIKALEPAEVDRAAKTKNIAVVKFKNDYVGLSNKIETNLLRFKIENKPYFTMVSRGDINKILREQRFQNSGLVDLSTAVEMGNIIGAEALISGRLGDETSYDTHFYERRSRCADKKCKERYYYKVRCKKRV